MSFRESIAYNKNLLTGETTEVKKYKPVDALMIGKAKIELYDENGKQTEEAYSENIITNAINRYMYLDYFQNRLFNLNLSGASYLSAYPFAYMLLLTSTLPEDANMLTSGAMIGYCDSRNTYAGSSTLQGTINKTESIFDNINTGKAHFVFDFPTSSGNGTFNSIGWYPCPSNYYVTQTNIPIPQSVNSTTPYFAPIYSGGAGQAHFAFDPNYWYIYDLSNKQFYKYDMSNVYPSFVSLVPVSTDVANVLSIANFNNLTIKWDFVNNNWVVFTISPSYKVYTISADFQTVKSAISLPTAMTTINGYSITYRCNFAVVNGKYVFTGSNSAAKICLIKTDTSLNVLNAVTFTPFSSTYLGSDVEAMYPGTTDETLLFGYSYLSTNITFTIVDSNFTNLGNLYGCILSNLTSSTLMEVSNTKTYVVGSLLIQTNQVSSYMAANIYKFGQPLAYTLLANPVTKTSSNTMKITYDFTVQPQYF